MGGHQGDERLEHKHYIRETNLTEERHHKNKLQVVLLPFPFLKRAGKHSYCQDHGEDGGQGGFETVLNFLHYFDMYGSKRVAMPR